VVVSVRDADGLREKATYLTLMHCFTEEEVSLIGETSYQKLTCRDVITLTSWLFLLLD
jgi:hypothetical protein